VFLAACLAAVWPWLTVSAAIAVVLGGLNQPFDLRLRQVLPCPHVLVGRPFGGNCSIYGSWRDQSETCLGQVFRGSRIDDCSDNGFSNAVKAEGETAPAGSNPLEPEPNCIRLRSVG
jgi:hypothetical protein